jgi:hypothetical protein
VLVVFGAAAQAQSLESAVMPGPVIAGHADLEQSCDKCHVRFDRAAQKRLCLDCHKPVNADVAGRTGYHGRSKARSADCRSCHTEHKGRAARIVALDEKTFDHAETDFRLRGKHETVPCKQCHRAGVVHRKAPLDCNACHRDDDMKKGHKEQFGARCDKCHDEKAWKPALFNHDRDTRYRLVDRHRDAKCGDCHRGPLFREATPTRCVACHRNDDPHKNSLGDKCDKCHSVKGWKGAVFDHGTTRFALRDKHQSAKCSACHKEKGRFGGLGLTCLSCHERDDREKGHQGNYGKKCESCHNAKAFKPATFSHDRDTKFPLAGKHAKQACKTCHKGALYVTVTKAACIACHKDQDVHFATYGLDCASCHVGDDWRKIKPDAPLPESARRVTSPAGGSKP